MEFRKMKLNVPYWKLVLSYAAYDICKVVGMKEWAEKNIQIIKEDTDSRREAKEFLNS